jgi:hypothetical protein
MLGSTLSVESAPSAPSTLLIPSGLCSERLMKIYCRAMEPQGQPLYLDVNISIAAAIEEAVKAQDLELSARSRSSSLSSLSTLGDCGGPCCAGELDALLVNTIPTSTPILPAATIQSVNAAPPAFTARSSTGVFPVNTSLTNSAAKLHARRPPTRPIGVPSATHTLFTFRVPASGTAPPFRNAPLQDCTNTAVGAVPSAPGQPSRKRRHRTPKSGEPSHQAKRLKKNPPVQTSTRKDRKADGRIKQAATQAVFSTANWTTLGTSRHIDPPHQLHSLEDVLLMGMKLVTWDGV